MSGLFLSNDAVLKKVQGVFCKKKRLSIPPEFLVAEFDAVFGSGRIMAEDVVNVQAVGDAQVQEMDPSQQPQTMMTQVGVVGGEHPGAQMNQVGVSFAFDFSITLKLYCKVLLFIITLLCMVKLVCRY